MKWEWILLGIIATILQVPSTVPGDTQHRSSRSVGKHLSGEGKASGQAPQESAAVDEQTNTNEVSKPKDISQPVKVGELPQLSINKDWMDRGLWVFNGLLVIVGLLQWHILRKQQAQLREHSEHFEHLSAAGADNAKAARDTATGIMESERPWIIISPEPTEPILYVEQPGDNLRNVFVAAAKNAGRTPARLKQFSALYELREDRNFPQEPSFATPDASFDGVTLVPNDSISIIAFLRPNPTLTASQRQAIENGTQFLYAYGFVKYEDVYGRTHESRFGYEYYVPQGGTPQALRGFSRGGPMAYNMST